MEDSSRGSRHPLEAHWCEPLCLFWILIFSVGVLCTVLVRFALRCGAGGIRDCGSGVVRFEAVKPALHSGHTVGSLTQTPRISSEGARNLSRPARSLVRQTKSLFPNKIGTLMRIQAIKTGNSTRARVNKAPMTFKHTDDDTCRHGAQCGRARRA